MTIDYAAIKPKPNDIFIFDECDKTMFGSPQEFVDFIHREDIKKCKILCLTATPDDGKVTSLESRFNQFLGF